MRAGKSLAQRKNKRRGADQVADVVAADDEDSRMHLLPGLWLGLPKPVFRFCGFSQGS